MNNDLTSGRGGKRRDKGSRDLAEMSTGLMGVGGVGRASKVMLGLKLGSLEGDVAHQSGGAWRGRGGKGARAGQARPSPTR